MPPLTVAAGWKSIEIAPWEFPGRHKRANAPGVVDLDHYRTQIHGQRDDGTWFYINLVSPSVSWLADVERAARKRLLTFTSCSCCVGHVCGYHKEMPPGPVMVPDWEYPAEEED